VKLGPIAVIPAKRDGQTMVTSLALENGNYNAGRMLSLGVGFLALAFLSLAACSDNEGLPEPGELKTYSGIYLHGFEASMFIPSSVTEYWWIAEDPSLLSGLREIPVTKTAGFSDARYMHLIIKGRVSELGVWGHLGAGQRELVVSEVLDIEPATLDEFLRAHCKLPLPEWLEEVDRKTAVEECRRVGVSGSGQ
jgi:hypothetical protein